MFYGDRPKVDILLFADEIDANAALIHHMSGEEDEDDRESSYDDDLHPNNPEFNVSTTGK